jgi:uncharacterized membrane protein YedE/YeeE
MFAWQLSPRLQLPTGTVVDGKLLLGAAVFGAGWGLSALCPVRLHLLPFALLNVQ